MDGTVLTRQRDIRKPTPLWQAVVKRLLRWHELRRQRQQLASLSDAALQDLGLSRADTWVEAQRPFWDDPFAR